MKEKSPEQKETLDQVNLIVTDKEADKNHMVAFGMKMGEKYSEEQLTCYNEAIEDVLNKNNLRPFHQIGHDSTKGPQAWEVWKDIGKEALEALLPEIHAVAEEISKTRYEIFGVIE